MDTNEQGFTPAEVVESHQLVLPTEKDFELIFMGKVDDVIAEHEKVLKKLLKGDPRDKKAYLAVKDFKNKIPVKMRTGTCKKVDKMLEDVRKYTEKTHEIKNGIITKVKDRLEDPAIAYIQNADRIAKEEADRIAKEKKDRLDARIKEVVESGAPFNGQWYGINDITIGVQMLEEMSEELYQNLVSKIKIQTELNAEAKRKEEEERKRLADLAEEQRKENERIANELAAQKAKLDKEKADMEEELRKMNEEKIRMRNEIRASKLLPYINFIRDYSKVLNLPDEEFESELLILKEAQAQHLESEAQKAKREQEEAKAREIERQTLAEKSKPLAELGFVYDFKTETWNIAVGFFARTLSKKDVLDIDDKLLNDLRIEVADAKDAESKIIAKEEAAKKEAKELAEKQKEEARKALLSDKQSFNEYITELKKVSQPIIKDAELSSKLNSIVNLLKEVE